MGHQKYRLVWDVEGPYGHPPQVSLQYFFYIDFYAYSDET